MASPPPPASTACRRCGKDVPPDGAAERKFCGPACRKAAKKARKRQRGAADRAHPFVCGFCHHCGGGYVLTGAPHPDTPARYCSSRCLNRQRWQISGGGFCAGCQHRISDPHALVCGPCWELAVRACLSKQRYASQAVAQLMTRFRNDNTAYQCTLCDGWHHRSATARTPHGFTSTRLALARLHPVYRQLRARGSLTLATAQRLGLPRSGLRGR